MNAPSLDPALVRQQESERERERAFWHERHAAFRQAYPDQFVAVWNGEVVVASSDLQQLVIRLREQGLDPTDVWVQYIAATPRRMLL